MNEQQARDLTAVATLDALLVIAKALPADNAREHLNEVARISRAARDCRKVLDPDGLLNQTGSTLPSDLGID